MPRAKKKYHYLYKTTNMINGKFYVGMHSTSNLDDKYLGSGLRLRRSIRKYGEENFVKEILTFFQDRESLIAAEVELVNSDLIKEELCMNLRPGGTGGWTPEQQRQNAHKSNAKQRLLIDTDPEWVKSRFENFSIARKDEYATGKREVNHFYDWTGKQHSEDTKNKIGQANSIKQLGDLNSQFGTCWITDGETNKKVKLDNLQTFLASGWTRGRKL